MRILIQDLSYAFRQLLKAPGFTITVLLTLALGIGANSAIFTLVNAILLHNLPVTDPKTLIRIGDEDDCCVNGGWHDNGDYLRPWSRATRGGPSLSAVRAHRPLPNPSSVPSSPATTFASSDSRRQLAAYLWTLTTRRAWLLLP